MVLCAASSSHFIVRAIVELAADVRAEEMLLMMLPVVDEGAGGVTKDKKQAKIAVLTGFRNIGKKIH